jgi:cold-inducible RNA-binding protein
LGTRVYVGNLSFNTSEDSLRAMCAQDGRNVAKVSIVTDRDTGSPRGFAFVDFASEKDAQAAIAAMNGAQLDGRSLTVNEAREREPRGGGGGGGGGRGGPRGGGGGGRRGGY